MAAYGALVSVMQIMDQLHHHPHPPISLLHKEQAESLAANVTFLQEFLEGYNPRVSYTSEADPLESRIAEAAYAAEDVIENYVVDQIRAQITDDGGKISSTEFYQGLEKVIEEMDLIKVEVTEKKMQGVQIIKKQSTTEAASLRSSSTAHKVTTTIGLDEVLNEMLEKIARGARVRQIIPIVGMGGLGKTTLARNIYENQLVKEHFDIRAWSTISQVHNARKILTEIIDQVGIDNDGVDLCEGELGLKLYKHLMGKRYLVVMDDMWSIQAWDKVRSFFPENGNGSRVVVTTRLSNLASMFDYSDGLDMKFMDDATSWNLFCSTVFGEETCPLELEDVGKKIVEGCKGLPLSIVVVGGLLSKSEPTAENWEAIEENLSSVVNSEDGGSCLQILYTSYNNLPVHIKSCFLYMGIFDEDEDIPVRLVIPLWVAEGFIKPVDGKSLEELGEEYVEDLVGRNLVLVGKRDLIGKVEYIKLHDLVRDLCLREGEKDKFLCDLKQSNDGRESRSQRRVINLNTSSSVVLESVEGATAWSLVRTLMGDFPTLPSSGLLRVYFAELEEGSSEYHDDEEIVSKPLNLRCAYLDGEQQHSFFRIISSSAPFLWNFQTLLLEYTMLDNILDIWKMPLLRHVISHYKTLCLPDPPPLGGDEVVLKNLHTLEVVCNLKLSEEVVKRIPNIIILKLEYDNDDEEEDYCLNNLQSLNKLQELDIIIWFGWDLPSVQELSLPYSLKQLTLEATKLPWEEMSSKIGCLPLLQVLALIEDAFIGSVWETVEGQFSSLNFLVIEKCDLENWITDNTHFPRLECLVLRDLRSLKEIPSCIGDIPTLRSIEVQRCSDSVEESAWRIQEEQEEYDNQLLQIHLMDW